MSKFLHLQSRYWRQRGECCIFIQLLDVLSDDGKTAELRVKWCRQLDKGWRALGVENTRVRERDYASWSTHFPRGEDLDAI